MYHIETSRSKPSSALGFSRCIFRNCCRKLPSFTNLFDEDEDEDASGGGELTHTHTDQHTHTHRDRHTRAHTRINTHTHTQIDTHTRLFCCTAVSEPCVTCCWFSSGSGRVSASVLSVWPRSLSSSERSAPPVS